LPLALLGAEVGAADDGAGADSAGVAGAGAGAGAGAEALGALCEGEGAAGSLPHAATTAIDAQTMEKRMKRE
jgi:hypothetical protein